MSGAPTQQPLYLRTGTAPVFAMFHPSAVAGRRRAVLLCPPFGWEDMCSYRSRRDWAEHLALEGYATLRFDFPGSGDSAGAPTDPGQLDSWTRAVSEAAQWLLQSSGATEVVGIGIGLGGLLACRAMLLGAPIEELVLWNVPGRGRTLLRELRAFAAMEVAYIPDDSGHPEAALGPKPLEDGAIVANGYRLSAETVASLEQLDLRDLVRHAQGPRRALLLGREGIKVDKVLRETFEQADTQLQTEDGPGYGEMILNPQDARPPTEVFRIVSSWLNEAETIVSQTTAPPAPVEAPDRLQMPFASNGTPSTVEDALTLPGLREMPLYVQGPEGPLFGILTEPLGERRQLCAVLMNAGPQRRTGPNRMWVEIARRWAAIGVPTLRLDVSGVGDSDGDTLRLARVASLYSKEYVGQALSALDLLAERGLPERVLMLGLCSGAYWSMHAALQDDRIAALALLNPRTLIWDEWVYAVRRSREWRKQLLLGSTWRKVITGDLTLARHLETARALADRAVSAPGRTRRRLAGSAPAAHEQSGVASGRIEGVLDTLRDRDQRTLMMFTGQEPLLRDFVEKGLLDRLDRWPNLRVEILGTSADTHTLSPPWLQQHVHTLVDEVLQRELELIPTQ